MSLYKCMRVGVYFLISLVIMKEICLKRTARTNILISIDSSVLLDWHDYGCWQRRLTN
jgi:hypothetical protein